MDFAGPSTDKILEVQIVRFVAFSESATGKILATGNTGLRNAGLNPMFYVYIANLYMGLGYE